MVPVQTRVSEVRLALQEGRRTLDSLTEVVVVVTECRLHAIQTTIFVASDVQCNVGLNDEYVSDYLCCLTNALSPLQSWKTSVSLSSVYLSEILFLDSLFIFYNIIFLTIVHCLSKYIGYRLHLSGKSSTVSTW